MATRTLIPSMFTTLALSGFVLLLAACSPETAPEGPPGDAELTLGRTIYVNNCASCHGAAGGGNAGPKLADGLVLESHPEAADTRSVIESGSGAMPAYEDKLSDQQLDAVVRYVREVVASDPPDAETEAASS